MYLCVHGVYESLLPMFILINNFRKCGHCKGSGKTGSQALVPNVKILATTSLLNAPLARVQAALKDSLQRFVTFK